MSVCTRCGNALGLFHNGPLCAACETSEQEARLQVAAQVIAQIRASGGADDAAKTFLASLLVAEAPGGQTKADWYQTVRSLAISAVEAEMEDALATDDPTGVNDDRARSVALALAAVLPDDVALAKTVQPHILELQLRDIRRGRLPILSSVAIPLEGESALFEDHAELLEPSNVKGTSGSFASTRVRVSDRVSVRAGGFGAETSLKRVEMHSIDRGMVTVTTRRVVFIGTARDIDFKRSEVLTTVTGEPTLFGLRSITFHFEKRASPIGFLLGSDSARLLDAILHYQPPPPPPKPAISEEQWEQGTRLFAAARERELEEQAVAKVADERAQVIDHAIATDQDDLFALALEVIGTAGIAFGDFRGLLGLTDTEARNLLHEMTRHNLAGFAGGWVSRVAR